MRRSRRETLATLYTQWERRKASLFIRVFEERTFPAVIAKLLNPRYCAASVDPKLGSTDRRANRALRRCLQGVLSRIVKGIKGHGAQACLKLLLRNWVIIGADRTKWRCLGHAHARNTYGSLLN